MSKIWYKNIGAFLRYGNFRVLYFFSGLPCRVGPTLEFKYKLYCDDNYYSSTCSVHCVASDTDLDGHYTCDPATGRIICRPGRLPIPVLEFAFYEFYEFQQKSYIFTNFK